MWIWFDASSYQFLSKSFCQLDANNISLNPMIFGKIYYALSLDEYFLLYKIEIHFPHSVARKWNLTRVADFLIRVEHCWLYNLMSFDGKSDANARMPIVTFVFSWKYVHFSLQIKKNQESVELVNVYWYKQTYTSHVI